MESHKQEIVIVGYNTKRIDDDSKYSKLREIYAKTISAPANYKAPDKISEYVQQAIANFDEEAGDQPYTGMLDSVLVVVPGKKTTAGWKSEGRFEASKPSVAKMLAGFFKKTFPPPYEDNRPPFMVYAYEPRRLFKMLGLECATAGVKVPSGLWLGGNSHYRDVRECVLPREVTKYVTFEMAIEAFSLDTVSPGYEPMQSPEVDAKVIFELLVRLDIVNSVS